MMSRLSLYVLKQLMGPIALFAFLMTCVVWLSTSLHFLDLVISRGQSADTFVYLTVMILPSLLVIILPIAYYFGTLYALSKLNSDSELVVMASAGFSRAQLSAPVFLAAAITMAFTYLCALYLMPAGQRAVRDKVVDIRADLGAALLNEGTFNPMSNGVTVFIRSIDSDGRFRGVLVHDSRNAKAPITYLAESGEMVQTPAGPRLIMVDGTIEQARGGGAHLSVLKFERDVFNLDQFASPTGITERAANERYLGELLHPDPRLNAKTRGAFIAEGHNRISEPLYCIAFALIALAAVTSGRRARGANALRMSIASVAATGLRIAGYGVQGVAASHPELCVLFYVVPLLGALAGWAMLAGFIPIFSGPAKAAGATT
jgi:lipopolysaccharide export system permease protein